MRYVEAVVEDKGALKDSSLGGGHFDGGEEGVTEPLKGWIGREEEERGRGVG